MLIVGLAAQKVPNFLAFATNTSVSMIASSSSPLYQPSIQVRTILIPLAPPSMNCLQDMVDRSSTTAWAGTGDSANDDSPSAAANNITLVVFMMISPQETRQRSMIRFLQAAPVRFRGNYRKRNLNLEAKSRDILFNCQ